MESSYYSFVLSNSSPEKYQLYFEGYIETNGIIKNKVVGEGLPFSNHLIDMFFIYSLWKCDLIEMEQFLNYHYQKYNGVKKHFIIHTQHLIKLSLDNATDQVEIYGNFLKPMLNGRKLKADICLKWLENIEVMSTPSIESSKNLFRSPFNKIFVNIHAYEFFNQLRLEITTNPKHAYADYSFIMQKMILDGFLIQTNHGKLISFIDNEYGTNLAEKYCQFKKYNNFAKNACYSRLKKVFGAKIQAETGQL